MKKIIALVLALSLCLGMVAATAVAEDKLPKIAFLGPISTHAWVSGITYQANEHLVKLAGEGKLEYKIYSSSNAEEMTTQMDEAILWGCDAMILAPQWTGMEVPVQAAVEQGIVVVNFDIDIAVDGVYKVTGDNYSMGAESAKYIVERVGQEGIVVALPVPTSGSVSDLRMQGFNDTIKEIAPNLTVLEYASAFTRDAGLADMADILVANPQIDAVFSLDDETSIGALQAIIEQGRTDIKAITGGGGCQEYFGMMTDEAYANIWVSSATYAPNMIVNCIENAVAVLNGETVENSIVLATNLVDRDNVADFLNADSPY